MSAVGDIIDSQEHTQGALFALAELNNDELRQDLVLKHPELRQSSAVEKLTAEAVRQLRIDLSIAEQFAAAACWLAEELADEYCRGRSQRAAANVAHFKGEHERASTLYDAALECFLRADDPKEVAITQSSALRNLIFIGQYDLAFEWASEARDVFEALGDRLRLARLELNFANILFRQDRWEEAASRYEAAYEEFRSVGESQDVAISLRNMAVCHVSLNNFLQAVQIYEKAREYCLENDLPLLVGEVDYNIAYLYYLRGEYTRAIELYQKTRVRCSKIGDRYHASLCDLDQAEIFLELNLIEEAVDLAQSAFAGFDELGMPYETAKSLVNLALAVNRQGKVFLALELLVKAREIFSTEQNQVWPAMIDLYQALVLYRAGRPLEAARLARNARDSFSVTALPTKIATCEVLLAGLYLENGDYDHARESCSAALSRLALMDVPAIKFQIQLIFGRIEEAAGSQERALESYRRAQESLERLRGHLQIEETKVPLLEDKLVVYESLVPLVLHGEESPPDKPAAFEFFEKAKSRSLADLVAFRAHALPATSAARSERAGLVRQLREELNWYYRQIDLQEMRGDDRSLEEVAQLREVSRRQEDHLIRTLGELQSSDQEFSSLQEASTLEVDEVRAAIPEDALLVEYYFSRGTIYACVLGRGKIEILPVSVVSRVRELHRLLNFQLSKFRLGTEYVDEYSDLIGEATDLHLRELFGELIAPILEHLDKGRLIIVPHGFLYYIPFHALFDGELYFSDRFSISYSPSASVFSLGRTKTPDFEERSAIVAVEDSGGATSRLQEAEEAAQLLPGSQLFTGARATEGVLRGEAKRCRMVYIAASVIFRQDNPMFSSIRLNEVDLSFFDLYSLDLAADLIILTGCGEDLSVDGGGDEIVGMTRGFLYAGAKMIMLNLWQVDARSRAVLLRAYFQFLGRGLGNDQALQKAMKEVRQFFPHPYYWSPFVLFGDAFHSAGSSGRDLSA
ncbi:MAG: CHAT domain-containing protein [bacterium]|nr:CHAT domain-containing protein [bacterium]